MNFACKRYVVDTLENFSRVRALYLETLSPCTLYQQLNPGYLERFKMAPRSGVEPDLHVDTLWWPLTGPRVRVGIMIPG